MHDYLKPKKNPIPKPTYHKEMNPMEKEILRIRWKSPVGNWQIWSKIYQITNASGQTRYTCSQGNSPHTYILENAYTPEEALGRLIADCEALSCLAVGDKLEIEIIGEEEKEIRL